MAIEPTLWHEPLLELVDRLYQADNQNAIGYELFKGLKKLIAFDAAIFTPINWQTLELQEAYRYSSGTLHDTDTKGSHAPFDSLLFDPLCLTRLNSAVKLSDTLQSKALSTQEVDMVYQHTPYCHAMGIVASWRQQPVAAIRLYRQAADPDFSEAELKLLNRLALHVANAVYLQDAIIALEPLRETGLIVYGHDGHLIYKNATVNLMLGDMPLEAVLKTVRKGNIWLKNNTELYRAEVLPLTPNSLLSFITKQEDSDTHAHMVWREKSTPAQHITIIAIEPFRRRQAIANRLKQSGLSPREIEVSLGIMRGLSNANIAKQLFIDEKTVKDHLQHIYAKIRIKTRTELISKMLGLHIELAHHEEPHAAHSTEQHR